MRGLPGKDQARETARLRSGEFRPRHRPRKPCAKCDACMSLLDGSRAG